MDNVMKATKYVTEWRCLIHFDQTLKSLVVLVNQHNSRFLGQLFTITINTYNRIFIGSRSNSKKFSLELSTQILIASYDVNLISLAVLNLEDYNN